MKHFAAIVFVGLLCGGAGAAEPDPEMAKVIEKIAAHRAEKAAAEVRRLEPFIRREVQPQPRKTAVPEVKKVEAPAPAAKTEPNEPVPQFMDEPKETIERREAER